MEKWNVCLLNDSFPPVIDGVANAVYNYARIIEESLGHAVVGTPYYPGAEDEYSFPVVRYRSVDTTRLVGYRTGYPFSASALRELEGEKIDVIHSHCPIMSTLLARTLRKTVGAPIILTYHTKFDIDIARDIRPVLLQSAAVKVLVKNISACDEVWVVSRGAGENLRSLGYQGEYRIMENGVDFPRGAVAWETCRTLDREYEIKPGLPVFLFVGRLMWYKGIRIILDALEKLRQEGTEFTMLFVGDGMDRKEIEDCVQEKGLQEDCIFTGAIHDREKLRAFFSRADLFLFPSVFDTNGIVVREAAACGLASVLIAGSCAAEGITDGRNGYLIEENAEAMAACLRERVSAPEACHEVGERAMAEIYVSWDEAVRRAYDRYHVVMERCENDGWLEQESDRDELFSVISDSIELLNRLRQTNAELKEEIRNKGAALYDKSAALYGRLWENLDRFL
ncbi:MAG: glycosyltransferase family 4 protein [Lachnospiraceae bacterium]|jgi:1,2-diacylglycerol 3-alpha-glucosyltransferase|nr:glycosyltransferase family 4 protein [Lachnospiraceae bacterium]